jgi:hypothetical protein
MDAAGALGDCANVVPATATVSRADADRVSSERRVITWILLGTSGPRRHGGSAGAVARMMPLPDARG